MGLSNYEKVLTREVELPKGVKCCLKEFGTPEYWRPFYAKLNEMREDGKTLTPEQEYDIRAYAMAHGVVVWIDDDDRRITDKDELFDILRQKKFWELLQDLTVESSKHAEYESEDYKNTKKSLSSTSEILNDGDISTLAQEQLTQTLPNIGDGALSKAS